MSDQSKLGLGQIITKPQQRDAIHVAVAPVTAAQNLRAGEHVGFMGNTVGRDAKHIGVVDPFLKEGVEVGQRFWLFLYPGSITSLRHEWSHPNFAADSTPVANEHEKWLRDFANETGADYCEMMDVAATHCEGKEWGGDYLIQGGRWEGQGTPDEFWTHFEAVTGKKPTSKYGLPGIFSCSC